MHSDRFPKLQIKSFDLDSESANSNIATIELIVKLKSSPQLFEEVSHAIMNIIEITSKFDDEVLSNNQRSMLRSINSDLKSYLIKNS